MNIEITKDSGDTYFRAGLKWAKVGKIGRTWYCAQGWKGQTTAIRRQRNIRTKTWAICWAKDWVEDQPERFL